MNLILELLFPNESNRYTAAVEWPLLTFVERSISLQSWSLNLSPYLERTVRSLAYEVFYYLKSSGVFIYVSHPKKNGWPSSRTMLAKPTKNLILMPCWLVGVIA